VNLGNCPILLADFWGIFYGLKMAWDSDIRQLEVECDNILVVKMLSLQAQVPAFCLNVVSNIKDVLGIGM